MNRRHLNKLKSCALLATALLASACSPKPGTDGARPKAPEATAGAARAMPSQQPVATVGYGELPKELAPYAEAIARSRLAYTNIKVRKANDLAPWNSKLGGAAYWPKGQPYPAGPDGMPLALLAQLNFSEMPPLPGYPGKGLLQFFIAGTESKAHVYGMPMYDAKPYNPQHFFTSLQQQQWFRVVYRPQVLQDREQLQSTPLPSNAMMLPITGTAALGFTSESEPVSMFDYRFERYLGKSSEKFFAQFGSQEEAVANNYIAFSDKPLLAKVGGYSAPTQNDPRLLRPDEDWIVLLELHGSTAEDGLDMMWGDAGMGAFYIRRDDLDKLDFSKVVYYWDNH
jgi:uncharacterized protein YwqG